MSDTLLPPSASRSGRNRHYHDCEPTGRGQHYGICLFTLEAFERGQKLSESPCVEAMRSGTCPALAMRQAEQEAGRALYFKEPDPEKVISPAAVQAERIRNERDQRSYDRGRYGAVWGSTESQAKAQPKPVPVKAPAPARKAPTEMLEFDAAAIVNAMMVPRTVEQIKAEMLEVTKPAALRRKQDMQATGSAKPSVFDYLTAQEAQRVRQLKKELDDGNKRLSDGVRLKPEPGETPLDFARRKKQLTPNHA